jgi:hypothetical protein
MARVRSVGAIATVDEEEAHSSERLSVHLRLFAKTDDGLLAIDPHPETATVTVQARDPGALLGQVALVLGVAAGGQIPAEMRAGHWGRVVGALADQFGIETDPETLMVLPFELLADEALRELMDGFRAEP